MFTRSIERKDQTSSRISTRDLSSDSLPKTDLTCDAESISPETRPKCFELPKIAVQVKTSACSG
jgi:hypothetical protein